MKIVHIEDWQSMKDIILQKNLLLQYTESTQSYDLFAIDGPIDYQFSIYKESPAGAEQIDFETTYKPLANAPLDVRIPSGKQSFVSSSRPKGTETYFTTIGDNVIAGTIGDGKRVEWDASNNNDEIGSPPTGFKVKRIDVQFIDPLYIKEGTLYFYNCIKGSYGDVRIICPEGQYYFNSEGIPTLAVGDIVVNHYVNMHPLQGSVPMGDELNTEETQEKAIPPNYILRIDITLPIADITSNGFVEFECYRSRTVIL